VLIPLKVLNAYTRSERNQFGQKKKFDVAQKGILGKTHFGGYSVTRVSAFLNRGFFTVFLAFLVFFTAI
jgi:hypothetical protein